MIEPSASHLCTKCLISFTSRNKLFKHLKQCRSELVVVHNVSVINEPQLKEPRLVMFKVSPDSFNEKPEYVFRS